MLHWFPWLCLLLCYPIASKDPLNGTSAFIWFSVLKPKAGFSMLFFIYEFSLKLSCLRWWCWNMSSRQCRPVYSCYSCYSTFSLCFILQSDYFVVYNTCFAIILLDASLPSPLPSTMCFSFLKIYFWKIFFHDLMRLTVRSFMVFKARMYCMLYEHA